MPAGRPPRYKTVEELQSAIDDYFDNPDIRTMHSKDGTAAEIPIVTITGLALRLGFESRQSFYDYESHDKYSYAIKRARLMIEHGYEKLLISGLSPAGAIFALKQFGWDDGQDNGGGKAEPLNLTFTVAEAKAEIKVTNAKPE
jgi:hypothetical protein